MPYTTVTTLSTKTYSWTSNPDFIGIATVEDDTKVLSLQVTNAANTYGVFLTNNSGTDITVDFVTFLKGVITDLEALVTPAP